MNKERLEQAIGIMQRAGAVDMSDWQSGEVLETEAELHSCGNSACFAGWLAVSPEFQAAGGVPSPASGTPLLGTSFGYRAVIAWLKVKDELKKEVLELLVNGEAVISYATEEWLKSKNIPLEREKHYSNCSLIGWRDFKADDVIKILETLRD